MYFIPRTTGVDIDQVGISAFILTAQYPIVVFNFHFGNAKFMWFHTTNFFSSYGFRLRWKFALWLISARNSGQICSANNFKLFQAHSNLYFFLFFWNRKNKFRRNRIRGYLSKLMYFNVPFSFFSRRHNHTFDEFVAKVNQCAKFHRNPRPWLQELGMESFMYHVYVEKNTKTNIQNSLKVFQSSNWL